MHKIKLKTILTVCGAALLLQFCTQTASEDSQRAIDKPFSDIEVPAESWEVQPGKEAIFTSSRGSIVKIPADVFCYEDGSEVTTPVTVKYTEYQDGLEIMASGIPMVFDSAGVSYDFVSAGMLELRGFDQNGKEVLLKEGKAIDVDMASNVEGDFNLYYFDESGQAAAQAQTASFLLQINTTSPTQVRKGAWKNVSYSLKTKENPEKQALQTAFNKEDVPEEPLKPLPFNSSNFVFDLNINTDAYPEFKHFKGILWEYVDMKGSKNPEKNEWIFSEDWTNMSIERHKKKGVYTLILKNKQKQFRTQVRPVLDEANYKKALKAFDKQFEEYQTILADRQGKENQLRKLGGLIRSFQLTSTGVWNVDKIRSLRQQAIMVNADIKLSDQSAAIPETFYYITENNKGTVVMRYTKDRWGEFFYLKSTNPYLVAPLEDGRMAVFSKEQMQELPLNPSKEFQPFTFNMSVLDDKASSYAELQELINKNS